MNIFLNVRDSFIHSFPAGQGQSCEAGRGREPQDVLLVNKWAERPSAPSPKPEGKPTALGKRARALKRALCSDEESKLGRVLLLLEAALWFWLCEFRGDFTPLGAQFPYQENRDQNVHHNYPS